MCSRAVHREACHGAVFTQCLLTATRLAFIKQHEAGINARPFFPPRASPAPNTDPLFTCPCIGLCVSSQGGSGGGPAPASAGGRLHI